MTRLDVEPTDVAADRAGIDRLAAALDGKTSELYRRLAEKAARFGREDAARVFLEIEALGRASAQRERPDAQPSGGPAEPSTPVVDDEGLGENRNVAPYDAWALAVRNSERCFAFWTYLGAYAQDAGAVEAAERLAETAALLAGRFRVERRRAYPAARAGRRRLLPVGPGEFAEAAAREEAALSVLHRAIAGRLAAAGHPLASRLGGIADAEAVSAGMAPPDLAGLRPGPALPETADAMVDLALARLQTALDLYLRAAESAKDERTVAHAQRLSEAKLRAIAALDESRSRPR